ncbi:GDSL esterase/lipase At5g55050-like [Vitis riparia]|uniref:GDSL esterase/lipase At5g55050-like n=1 Tax=Vitis riparia TaxID=96939 RepID=UPI00155AF247|nr:GDSL esterase/lipase At5g55050-like [Vitis riparia]
MAKRWVSSFLFLSIFLAMVVSHSADGPLPALFILGDSTADVGTNTLLPQSVVRADLPFNGIDFPHSRPTGRFSNGFNTADFLAKHIGYRRSPPPFLSILSHSSSLSKKFLRGVNFASGGSGILDTTGQTLGIITLGAQIQQFTTVHSNLTAAIGLEETVKFLSKSLFVISTGSNDIINYFQSNNRTLPKEEFIQNLGYAYENHLTTLFDLGARKFGILSVPPIGCCPSLRTLDPSYGCLDEINEYATFFYTTIQALMQRLSSEYQGMKYSLGNAYDMAMYVVNNPVAFNFTDVKSACCGGGELNAQSPCVPTAALCSDRDKYLFWDLFHPTKHACKLAAFTLYTGAPVFVSPINFSQLAMDN